MSDLLASDSAKMIAGVVAVILVIGLLWYFDIIDVGSMTGIDFGSMFSSSDKKESDAAADAKTDAKSDAKTEEKNKPAVMPPLPTQPAATFTPPNESGPGINDANANNPINAAPNTQPSSANKPIPAGGTSTGQSQPAPKSESYKKTVSVNENSPLVMTCPTGLLKSVNKATYYSNDASKCSVDVTSQLKALENQMIGAKQYTIPFSGDSPNLYMNTMFGDPCTGYFKKLDVEYSCL